MNQERKTKQQLLTELQSLQQELAVLKKQEPEYEQISMKLIKQLNCLYGMRDLFENKAISLDEIIRGCINLIPPAWQYPAITCARAVIHHREYQTANFRPMPWKQAVSVNVRGETIGLIEVGYLEDKTAGSADPFLREEWNLLLAIGQRLGETIQRYQAEEELLKTNAQLHTLTARLQTVREEERARIAREIHDEFGQVLAILKMDIYWLNKKLSGNQELQEKTTSMLEFINSKIGIVQKYIMELRPKFPEHLSLPEIIKWQTEKFQQQTGIRCEVTLPRTTVAVNKDLSINIFRILQEALTNILRHARATTVNVKLDLDDEQLYLTIQDNGRGITREKLDDPGAFGIIGIRERCLLLGGVSKIEGATDRGTTWQIRVPLSWQKKQSEVI